MKFEGGIWKESHAFNLEGQPTRRRTTACSLQPFATSPRFLRRQYFKIGIPILISTLPAQQQPPDEYNFCNTKLWMPLSGIGFSASAIFRIAISTLFSAPTVKRNQGRTTRKVGLWSIGSPALPASTGQKQKRFLDFQKRNSTFPCRSGISPDRHARRSQIMVAADPERQTNRRATS